MKNIPYIGLALVLGLLTGYVIFGGAAREDSTENHDHSKEMATVQMWTCSMHPQIMQPGSGDCPICGMDLIPAAKGEGGLSADQFKMTENAMALANIATTVVGAGAESRILKLSGKIKENEKANAVQVAYFAGRIEKLFVNSTGERIHKGQRLAIVYSPELVSAQQELLTAASLKSSKPHLYMAVRNKLKLWKLSDDQIDAIEIAGKVQENVPIYAALPGTVMDKMVYEGDHVKEGQPLYKIADLNTVWAEFDAYESQLSSLKVGQKIRITTNAYANTTYDGEITFVDPLLNTSSRTAKVRAVLANGDGLFKPGMFVEGSVEGAETSMVEAITIPASAVLWTGKRSVVYVKAHPKGPVFEMREIILGNAVGETYTVQEGLKKGEEIVVNGIFTVDAEAQLQGKRSMMNRQGGRTPTGHSHHVEEIKAPSSRVSFQADFSEVIDGYLKLKDAFVSSDALQLKKSVQSLQRSLNNMLAKTITVEERKVIEKLESYVQNIENEVDIEQQRMYFKPLSQQVIELARASKQLQKTLYVQFCPMADQDRGAFWLSSEEEIRNPYFGDKMMTCGNVEEVVRF